MHYLVNNYYAILKARLCHRNKRNKRNKVPEVPTLYFLISLQHKCLSKTVKHRRNLEKKITDSAIGKRASISMQLRVLTGSLTLNKSMGSINFKWVQNSCYQIHAAIGTADLGDICWFRFTNMAENPVASRKSRKDVFKDKKILFGADALLKYQFLCGPIPSTFRDIKIFFFPEKLLLTAFASHSAQQPQNHRLVEVRRNLCSM